MPITIICSHCKKPRCTEADIRRYRNLPASADKKTHEWIRGLCWYANDQSCVELSRDATRAM